MKPEIIYGEKTYRSSNRLATSDVWKERKRGTNGKWYEPDKSETFKVRIKYDGKYVVTYINGVLDQKICPE